MSKRFTATEKWEKEWFQQLTPRLKCFWLYLCDHCDAAGVWEPNFGLASYKIGDKVSPASMKEFGDRVHLLPSGKYWISGFIAFQYPKLSRECKPHIPIFRSIEANGLSPLIDACSKGFHTLSEGYPKGIHTLQDKDTDKDKGKELVKDKDKAKEQPFAPPTLEEMKAFGATIGLPEIECEKCHDYYQSKDWKVGPKAQMKDWQAAARNWRRNWQENNGDLFNQKPDYEKGF
ncbi:hypothetical protein [Pedosphaera parvula]|nr:hypothetical protein [Pedosphaera parvula]